MAGWAGGCICVEAGSIGKGVGVGSRGSEVAVGRGKSVAVGLDAVVTVGASRRPACACAESTAPEAASGIQPAVKKERMAAKKNNFLTIITSKINVSLYGNSRGELPNLRRSTTPNPRARVYRQRMKIVKNFCQV